MTKQSEALAVSGEARGLTLYEVETQLLEAMQQADELEAAGDEEGKALALQILDAYLSESAQKRDSCAKFFRVLDASEAAINAEVDRLKERKANVDKMRQRMNEYVLAVMQRVNVKQLDGRAFTFKAKKNPPKVEITDPIAIPADYLRIPDPLPPVIDKKKISDDLKAGKEVAGAKLIQTERLVIE